MSLASSLAACLVFFLFQSPIAFAQYSSYEAELITKAREQKLWENRYWHLLLHYKPRWFAGFKSEADGAAFFNAKNGKTNPQGELEATIHSFFEERSTPSQCQFVARYHWLKEKLAIDSTRLPEKPCPNYTTWKNTIDPASMTLVFASFYMNNPASMFGHTYIRFGNANRHKDADLLDYAVNYSAVVGEDLGMLYAIKGLTGGYPGKFSTYPYYFKVQEYNNVESRDLWEFPLRFDRPTAERVLEHLWELGSTYFDYFFIDENCSYHLLSLLELANPNLELTDAYHFFVAPSDTVKQVAQQEGLITSVRYRPSLQSQLRQRWSLLSPVEKKMVLSTMAGKFESLDSGEWLEERRGLIVDTAITYLAWKRKGKELTELQKSVLAKRSEIDATVTPENAPLMSSPVGGHDSTRVGVGIGVHQGHVFGEVRFRAAYHDLLASEEGYPPNAQIELLKLHLRFSERDPLHVQHFAFADVLSLAPIDDLIAKPSWNLSAGATTLYTGQCNDCNAGYLTGGLGVAFQSYVKGTETFYLFGNANIEATPSISGGYRAGPKAIGGMYYDPHRRWKMNIEGTYDYAPLSQSSTSYRFSLNQRLSLGSNVELRIEISRNKVATEALAAFQGYY